jgi:hypothetical protein
MDDTELAHYYEGVLEGRHGADLHMEFSELFFDEPLCRYESQEQALQVIEALRSDASQLSASCAAVASAEYERLRDTLRQAECGSNPT